MNSSASIPTSGAQAIRRAIDILRAVAQLQRSGANLSRVARATGLNTSTSFRILRSLSEERILEYEETEKCYRIGALAYELGLAAPQEYHVQPRWRRAVEDVAKQTRLTTYLMARSNNEAVCLMCIEGSMVLRAMPVDVGQRLPLGIGAGSLAIISTLDDDEIKSILSDLKPRLATMGDHTWQPNAILERIQATRQRGFSMSTGTLAQSVTGIGIAIPASEGLAQLAISVSAVAQAFSPEEAKRINAILVTAIQQHIN